LRHGHVKEVRLRIPDRLLEAVRRVSEADVAEDAAVARADERHERRGLSVVRDEDDVVALVEGDLVRAVRSAGRDGLHDLPAPQVDDFHGAVAVAGPELIPGLNDEDAVWTRGFVASVEADEAADPSDEAVVPRADDVDPAVRPVREVVRLRRAVHPADVEAVERSAGDGDERELAIRVVVAVRGADGAREGERGDAEDDRGEPKTWAAHHLRPPIYP